MAAKKRLRQVLTFARASPVALAATLAACSGAEFHVLQGHVIRGWQAEDGLPQNTITSAVQTRDGYVWLGTYSGLARFDGVRFTVFDNRNTPAIRASGVTCLFEADDGVLWIGHSQGELSRYASGRFAVFPPPPGIPSEKISSLATDEHGDLWGMIESGVLVRYRDGQRLAPTGGGAEGLRLMERARDGTIWVVWKGALSHLVDGRLEAAQSPEEVASSYIHGIGAATDGVWIVNHGRVQKRKDIGWGNDSFVAPWGELPVEKLIENQPGEMVAGTVDTGLYLIRTSSPSNYLHFCRTNGLGTDWITCLMKDREGGIWVGTGGAGLFQIRPVRVQTVEPPDQWQGRAILGVFAARDGALWIGTEGAGVYSYKAGVWRQFGSADGVDPYAWSVVEDPRGELWVGSWSGGLFRRQGERFEKVAIPQISGSPLPALAAGVDGGVWAGTSSGLMRFDQGKCTLFGRESGRRLALVRALERGPDGTVWFGTAGTGLGRLADGRVAFFDTTDGLSSAYIETLYVYGDGSLWIGTAGAGLNRYRDGKFALIDKKKGLPDDTICHIDEDGEGYFWMSSHDGLIRTKRDDLTRCADGRLEQVSCMAFGLSDGMPTIRGASGMSPSGAKSADGRLWFPTSKGLAFVDPRKVERNTLAPPVAIESLLIDDRPVEISALREDDLVVSPGRHRFEFHYTGLSLAAPERVRFRYRLEGLEEEWIEAGTRRSANYSHIPPGDYRFLVRACNNDGVWNEKGAGLKLSVLPFVWQTLWFKVALVTLLVAATAGGVWFNTRQRMRRKLERLEQQRAVEYERSRIAQDIHDDLGSHLTRITMLSESARADLGSPEKAAGALQNIYGTARELTRAMDEIVWAVNPRHDTLEGLLNYLEKFAQDFLRTAGMGCRLDFPIELPAWSLTAEVRHNLFLAFKEALNNAAKHSGGTAAHIVLELDARGFALTVADNGIGFATAPMKAGAAAQAERVGAANPAGGAYKSRLLGGDGIENMRRRLAKAGGTFEIQSVPGQGTRARFWVPAAIA